MIKDFYFKMDGKVFESGMPLDIVIPGLENLQNIFDGSYKAITGKSRLTKKEREFFRIVVNNFEQGSFLSNFDIFVQGVQLTLPLISMANVNEIWLFTKNSYDFLKSIYSAAHAGGSNLITHNSDGSVSTQITTQNNTYNGNVFQIAKAIVPSLRGLDAILDGDKIETIEIGQNKIPEITLHSRDKGQFDIPISVQENPENLNGEIYDFNKYEKTGRIKIFDSQSIPAKTYRFKVIGSQNVEDYILSMAEKKIKTKCMVELSHDPLDTTKISCLHIINVEAA
jgi:hypothetical protein